MESDIAMSEIPRDPALAGVILAGGKNRRMLGRYKGSLRTPDGKAFAVHISDEMHRMTNLVYISFGETVQEEIEGCRIVRDEYKNCGPLGGLHAAMKAAAENGMELIMTAACDMPFVKAELFSYLYEQMGSYEGAVARSGGKVHPLAAIYSVKAVEVFGKQLESGDYRLLDALNKLKINYVDLEGTPFLRMMININTEEEYAGLDDMR